MSSTMDRLMMEASAGPDGYKLLLGVVRGLDLEYDRRPSYKVRELAIKESDAARLLAYEQEIGHSQLMLDRLHSQRQELLTGLLRDIEKNLREQGATDDEIRTVFSYLQSSVSDYYNNWQHYHREEQGVRRDAQRS